VEESALRNRKKKKAEPGRRWKREVPLKERTSITSIGEKEKCKEKRKRGEGYKGAPRDGGVGRGSKTAVPQKKIFELQLRN